MSDRLGFRERGGVWIKDETENVAGSHKARHLFGILIWLKVLERAGHSIPTPLAIASCGNAALAAAVVARAAQLPLEVFVPPGAAPEILARLARLDARLTTCPRDEGVPGDPCYGRFREALAGGALPFGCQGRDNGLTIEGGATLAFEMVSTLAAAGRPLDTILVQVGGGALGSACSQGFREAHALGAIAAVPRLYCVQTESAAPLARAFERVVARGGDPAALRFAATHRSEFMWPWETEPRSVASGILDDETYDWHALVETMLNTGGMPLTVGEDSLKVANALAREATGVRVSATGSAGLAGLLELAATHRLSADENVAVIFSGVDRAVAPSIPELE